MKEIAIEKMSEDKLNCQTWRFDINHLDNIRLYSYVLSHRSTRRSGWRVQKHWSAFDNRGGILRGEVPHCSSDEIRAAFKKQIDEMPIIGA